MGFRPTLANETARPARGIRWNRADFRALGRMALALAALAAAPASAVTQFKVEQRKPFNFDITSFTTTLSLPVSDKPVTVRMSEKQMQERIELAPVDDTVEPLSVLLADDPRQIKSTAQRLAAPGKEEELASYLATAVKRAKPVKKGMTTRTVEFDKDGFALVNHEAFSDVYSKSHHHLTLDTKELAKDKATRKELFRQLKPYFSKAERKKLSGKIARGETVTIDEHLLPSFAEKMVGKYIIYRGPNCFHAALAFQSPTYTSSSLINVKTETGYHRAMINYDELWRVLNRNFYEVDPEKVPLKYGDMLVFFEVPEEDADNLDKPEDYRWIRHTATYLFGGYTFSKGSKSPNTPYTVRTLSEEWRTWKKFTENLGVKVYRRSAKGATSVAARPPLDLSDWIY
jgi:hypothetical protein